MKQNRMHAVKRVSGPVQIGLFVFIVALLATIPFVVTQAQTDETLQELNQQLSEKRKQIQDLESQQDLYQQTVKEKQREQRTLTSDLEILDGEITSTQLEVEKTKLEIDSVKIEIEKTQEEIRQLADDILISQEHLSEVVQVLFRDSQKSYLEIALLNDSFSDFVRAAKYAESLEGEMEKTLGRLKTLKQEQEQHEQTLDTSRQALEQDRQKLESQEQALGEQAAYKEALLSESNASEQQYQELLAGLDTEEDRINSEVFAIENRVRQKLEEEGSDPLEALGEPIFGWPITPTRGISAYFRDPTYPFRKIFEHPAIDIPAPHGTAIAAPADGVVAIVRNLDWRAVRGVKVPAYNYLTILHGNGFSTVYGHLSRIDVAEGQYVTKGQIVAATGGTPGTAGAGTLTTGAHLHFEVRINGIPDDPLKYLP